MTREELRKMEESAHILCKDLFGGEAIFDVIKTGGSFTWRIFDNEGVCFAKGAGANQLQAYQELLTYLTEKAEC